MIDNSKIEQVLSETCSNWKAKGNGYIAKCPICGDSSKHNRTMRLNINFVGGKYNQWLCKCWNGGCEIHSSATNIYKFYMKMKGVSYKEAQKFLHNNSFEWDIAKIKSRLLGNEETKEPERKLDIDLENDCYNINSTTEDRIGKRYVRKLREFYLERRIPIRHSLYIAHTGKYKGRVILPVIMNKKLVYFQGRDLTGLSDKKYINPFVDKRNAILNYDNIDKNQPIVITEGIIDALMCGNQGTSSLGSSMGGFITNLMNNFGYKSEIIICLDNDKAGYAELHNLLYITKLDLYKANVKYFIIPPEFLKYKDLNEIKVNERDIDIYKMVIQNSYDKIEAKQVLSKLGR